MQAKGGVGKSIVASLLVQWHQHHGRPVTAFDTDALNPTLSAFKGLSARYLPVLDKDKINGRAMDGLVEAIIAGSSPSVVDNGSTSFQPKLSYLVNNDIAALLQDHHRHLVIHTVVVGGQPALDTLSGMIAMLDAFPRSCPVVVWVNEHANPFEIDGYAFEETRAYQDNATRLRAVVHLPPLDPMFNGRDVAMMLSAQLTFAEAIERPETFVVSKSRLFRVRQAIFQQLDTVLEAI